ncbi:terpenoid synthase [Thelephora ganbajun]|uniref:Terpenoid synthase n=1 Tax=Thelephora ganbajun TaxID=370292 RepID=A0ACB6ZPF9_THEGA|nr:terpenoid synthase [Thelephora ganbajun]
MVRPLNFIPSCLLLLAPQLPSAMARQRFEDVFPCIRSELIDHITAQGMPKEAIQWYTNNLNYNVPGGKLNRGISVVDSFQVLKGTTLTEDEYQKAAILGWCVELLQAFFLVSDDVMDSSITRRGQPCWYKNPEVGLIAINDAFMLESAIYHLIKSRFRQESYYVDLLELFHETTYQTEMGQLIDLITAPEDHVDLSKFNLTKHRLIVVYKTAFYSFYLPVALSMYMAGIPDSYPSPVSPNETVKPFDVALSILLQIGEYFQIQDDFLDYHVPPELLGKVGTDILDNKCSWVINTALAVRGTLSATRKTEIRAILDENYGRKDGEKEARVKAVLKELDIAEIYNEYEEGVYAKLKGEIEKIPEGPGLGLRRDVFTKFLGKIYKRQK